MFVYLSGGKIFEPHNFQERDLRSFTVILEVDAKHHASLIGKGGAAIQKLRDELDVQFDFPKRGKDGALPANGNWIKIIGYEAKVNAAKTVLESKIGDLAQFDTRTINIDPRIHARLIGGRGAGIKALQDQYKVRINFPRDKDSSVITVVGQFDDVADAINELENKASELVGI